MEKEEQALTKEQKQQTIFQIYAALGELSVLKKQTEQRMAEINSQIDHFEKELVRVVKLEEKEEAQE